MYQNFTPRPENKHDNGTSPLLIRDTSSFMVVFLLLFLSFRWCGLIFFHGCFALTLLPRFSAVFNRKFTLHPEFSPDEAFFFVDGKRMGARRTCFLVSQPNYVSILVPHMEN